MKIRPLGDRVLVDPIKNDNEIKGGIYIPDNAKEKPQEGLVVSLGSGKIDDNGEKIPFRVKVGDKVLFPKYGGMEVRMENKIYLIIKDEDILSIIT